MYWMHPDGRWPSARSTGHGRRRAFSLIELIVVIAIIGLLAGAAAIGVRSYLQRGRQTRVRMDLVKLEEALDSYYAENGSYPTEREGLGALARPSPLGHPPWLKQVPMDPWGNAYVYRVPGQHQQPFEIVCLGADGKEGGDGEDEDWSQFSFRNLQR